MIDGNQRLVSKTTVGLFHSREGLFDITLYQMWGCTNCLQNIFWRQFLHARPLDEG
jgi:hypothetical protein